MRKTDTMAHCLSRIAKVEDQVRTLSKTMADYHMRLTKLERRE